MGGRSLPKSVRNEIDNLHNQHFSFLEIAKRTGTSYNGVRRYLDPAYRESQNGHARDSYKPEARRQNDAMAQKVSLAHACSDDDNDLIRQLCGDPPRGRSALDRK